MRRLGVGNVIAVAAYRARCTLGIFERRLPIGEPYKGPFFAAAGPLRPAPDERRAEILAEADELLAGRMRFFSSRVRALGAPPNWLSLDRDEFLSANRPIHWSYLDEYAAGDIKEIWEPSRFSWALTLAQAYRLVGQEAYLEALNRWSADWVQANPFNTGSNWKCAQEASIRLMHVLLTTYLLGDKDPPPPPTVRFILEHCSRIEPTLSYAVAQDNNHGISEAAALFAAGIWLRKHASGRANIGTRWESLGRKWLENRVERLIDTDGSFSQTSTNYHRMMLDVLSFAEFWRRNYDGIPFSELFRERAGDAVRWLFTFTDPDIGDAPNLGPNDGARLFLSSGGYRDHRSSVQTASVLFDGEGRYPPGSWDEPLRWLGIDKYPRVETPRRNAVFWEGGYALLVTPDESSWAAIRFPRQRFRPSHADALHLDLWWKGQNLLRDGGTFSYNTDASWINYFSGTAAHNTIMFDDRDQMPRIGRYLFGEWIRCRGARQVEEAGEGLAWWGSYTDYAGCRHRREVQYANRTWRIVDRVEGFERNAVLRWRLAPGRWVLDGDTCAGEGVTISVSSNAPVARCELTEGWEARMYGEKTRLPVLEVEVRRSPADLATTITLGR